MSSYNSNNNDNNNNEPKNHLGYNDTDLRNKIEQIKANKQARLEGKSPEEIKKIQAKIIKRDQSMHRPVKSVLGGKDLNGPIMSLEQAVAMDLRAESNSTESSEQKKEEFNNPSTFVNNNTEGGDSSQGKDYSYYQSQIQSKFAQFQGERINEIAKLARKDKHEILLFKQLFASWRNLTTTHGHHDFQLISMNENLFRKLTAWNNFAIALDGNDAGFVGHIYSDATGRFVPYFTNQDGKVVVEQLDMSPGNGTENWYDMPLAEDRALLTPPYAYAINGVDVLMTTISIPVHKAASRSASSPPISASIRLPA